MKSGTLAGACIASVIAMTMLALLPMSDTFAARGERGGGGGGGGAGKFSKDGPAAGGGMSQRGRRSGGRRGEAAPQSSGGSAGTQQRAATQSGSSGGSAERQGSREENQSQRQENADDVQENRQDYYDDHHHDSRVSGDAPVQSVHVDRSGRHVLPVWPAPLRAGLWRHRSDLYADATAEVMRRHAGSGPAVAHHPRAGALHTLKTLYRDGTTHVVFEPLDYIARLAALVPRPRAYLTRYHGVFAPHSRWRADVTLSGRGVTAYTGLVDWSAG